MTAFPWEVNAQATEELRRKLVNPNDAHLWFVTNAPARPELQRDLLTGLWPGQEHPMDAPDFLNRAKGPLATNRRS